MSISKPPADPAGKAAVHQKQTQSQSQTQTRGGSAQLSYVTLDSAFDEMLAPGRQVRPHWRGFADYFASATPQDLGALSRETQRRLKEQGVNYNVYDNPEGMRRPWRLDPLPMLFTEKDWSPIEAGLQQRAQLFSLILNDVMGSQTCLKAGLIPPQVIFQNPGYLQAMVGGQPAPLTLYAADLGRGPDGQWWVLSDRTQGPSGAGYILEARMVTKRVLGPQGFGTEEYPTAPLAQFFFHLKRHLAALSPEDQRDPTIVLLSPGVGNEVYFEHTFLAAQLGITLVTGDDLTVRQGKVYLKTVDDLQQVDVIIRRVDDSYCDPLNFRSDSMLGVPGLAQAQMLGKVALANPLGSGFLESAALLPFLPGLAKHFLAQELLLPEVATWWCGQPKERQYVVDHLERLVIKKVDRSVGVIYGNQLSRLEKQQLTDRIQRSPWLYVGQQALSFSTVPTLTEGALNPRHLVLRAFTAGDGERYDVMPGGLTRVSPDADTFVVSSQMGGVSKDTWLIRASGTTREVLRLSPTPQRRKASAILTSRAAENLFWLGRYLERSESLLRLIRAYLRQLDNFLDYGDEADRQVLISLKPSIHVYFDTGTGDWLTAGKLQQTVLDRSIPGTVANNLHTAVDTAYTVRDLWSGDCWRAVEGIEDLLESVQQNGAKTLVLDQINQPFLTALLAFWGASQESLAVNHGGLWLQLGKRLERAQNLVFGIYNTCRNLSPDDQNGLRQVLLETNDCLNSHRRRYGTDQSNVTLWQHLLIEPTNPRSLLSGMQEMEPLLNFLNPNPHQGLMPLEKMALAIITPLKLAEAGDWSNQQGRRENLAEFLLTIRTKLNHFGLSIEQRYFTHAQPVTRLIR